MLRRIGRGQVDGLSALGQRDRDGGGNRGLADAALSHDHDKAMLRGGEVVNERLQIHESRRQGGRCRRLGRQNLRCGGKKAPQRLQAHDVLPAQRDFRPRKRAQFRRHLGEGLRAAALERGGESVLPHRPPETHR